MVQTDSMFTEANTIKSKLQRPNDPVLDDLTAGLPLKVNTWHATVKRFL